MLSQPNRLPSSDIPLVMRRGRRVASDFLTLVMLKSEADVSRFAFIVSIKIDKRATRRNRIRRLLRESVRHQLGQIPPGVDCIITARRDISGLSQSEVEKTVIALFKRVI